MLEERYIRLVSDLHFSPGQRYEPVPLEEDWDSLLLVAGDLGDYETALTWLTQMSNRFSQVVVVLGNHDFYNHQQMSHQQKLAKWHNDISRIEGCVLLENEQLEWQGLRVIGSSLWTDFEDDEKKMQAALEMADYRRIFNENGEKVTPLETQKWHRDSLEYIAKALDESHLPSIVVTHHSPTWRCVTNPDYQRSLLTHAYVTELEAFMRKHQPLLWCYGHTHEAFKKYLGSTLVLSNPHGFALQDTGFVYDQQIVISGNECITR